MCKTQEVTQSVISGFPREVDENFTLLSHYTSGTGISRTMFRNNLPVASSGVKMVCPEMSVENCQA
jgi:hypothetical protein